jgi:hypothetical protein
MRPSEPGADLTFFDDPAIDRLLGMLMELAADLARERYRRLALERRLAERGLVDPEELDALADDPAFLADARSAEREAVERLLAPWLRDGSPLHPLRNAAGGAEGSTIS